MIRDKYVDANDCDNGFSAITFTLITTLSLDLLIEFYVTIRSAHILIGANRNSLQVTSNISIKSKRTLFMAVIYWNFIRLILAICYNAVVLYYTALKYYVTSNTMKTSFISNTLQGVFIILLSYAITADAEIVKVIEGKKRSKESNSNNSNGTKHVTQQTSDGTITPLPNYKSPNEPPRYSTGSYVDSKNKERNSGNINKLSFSEWANVVVGNEFIEKDDGNNNNNNNNKNNNEEDIIDEENDIGTKEIANEVADNCSYHSSSTSSDSKNNNYQDHNRIAI